MKNLKTVCLISIFVSLLFPSLVTAQYHVPDSIFREVLHSTYGITFDNLYNITNPEKVSNIVELDLDSRRISSLEGIEALPSLEYLSCNHNQLSSLDLSKNPKLTTLKCNSNKLITLNVSSNTELVELDCSHNLLAGLDLSSNTKITNIYCGSNPFESLDLSSNPALQVLMFPSNNLTSLDLSSNKSLRTLHVYKSSKFSKLKLHDAEKVDLQDSNTPLRSRGRLKNKIIQYSIALLVVLVGIFFVYLLFKSKFLANTWAKLKNVNLTVKVVFTFFILALIPSILMLPRVLKPGTPDYYYTTVPYIIFMIYFFVTAFILNLKDNNPKRNKRLNFLILITSAIATGGKLEAIEMFLALIVAPILILINVVSVIAKIVFLSKQRINKN
jgi:hypothetical protein